MARTKKNKARKSTSFQKIDSTKKKPPDYTDIAYKEAVSRLRYLLAESYSPQATPTKIPHVHTTKPDDSGDETDASMAVSERSRHHHTPYRLPYFSAKRSLYSDTIPKLSHFGNTLNIPKSSDVTGSTPLPNTTPRAEGQQPPPELMAFIERQEDYIEQLEKESLYCREELSNLLSKVKDVISENEGLHEKEKSGILKSVFDYLTSGGEEEDEEEEDLEEKKDKKKSPIKKKRLEGPSIVFESRISELEAQLTQNKIDLRKSQEEAEMYKKKLADIQPGFPDSPSYPSFEACKQQIETLQREKEDLADNVAKLTAALSQFRDKEADATHKVKRSFDLVDQAQFEKAQAELEMRRLKEELERQHEKLRDLLQEQGRRVQDERSQAERRYTQQVEQLTCDLSSQWDTAGKLQLELEKQRRTESELRRELQQKNAAVDELKKELQTKIAGLQSEATQSAAERGSLEQELAASRLASERAERDARQESARLQAEVTALRQRLDRADADLLHSRRENLRLTEQIASLERELNLAKMMKEGIEKAPVESGSPSKQSREKELTSMILDMEAKHVHTVGELENMIQSQTQLMEKLKDECHSLTQKLEESSARHKEEMAGLQSNVDYLSSKLEAFEAQEWRDNTYAEGQAPGSEHGFELEQQPQYEPQSGYEPEQQYASQPSYPLPEPEPQPQPQPQSEQDYDSQPQQSQPEYHQQAQYEPQPDYEMQSDYQPQPEYAPQPGYESEYIPQSEYEQPEYGDQPGYETQQQYDQEELGQQYDPEPSPDPQPSTQQAPPSPPPQRTHSRPMSRQPSATEQVPQSPRNASRAVSRQQSSTEQPSPTFQTEPGSEQTDYELQPSEEPQSGSAELQPGAYGEPSPQPQQEPGLPSAGPPTPQPPEA